MPPTTLILLTCHAIYQGAACGPPSSPNSWLLAPFQIPGNEHLTFLDHICLASALLKSDSKALLVISGGCTRGEARRSEARGYFEAGVEVGVWGWGDLRGKVWEEEGEGEGEREGEGEARIILEEEALDSFGNLVRGLVAFWRGAGGVWPGRVEVVSHGFKGERFLGLHCRALRLGGGEGREDGRTEKEGEGEGEEGEERKGVEVVFRGIDPRFMDEQSSEFDAVRCEETRRGEREFGYREWEGDLWGVGEKLRRKRDRRDAWGGGRVTRDGVGDAGRVSGGEEYQGRALFESEEERTRSEVRTRWLEAENGMTREEVIVEGVEMPWELGALGRLGDVRGLEMSV